MEVAEARARGKVITASGHIASVIENIQIVAGAIANALYAIVSASGCNPSVIENIQIVADAIANVLYAIAFVAAHIASVIGHNFSAWDDIPDCMV